MGHNNKLRPISVVRYNNRAVARPAEATHYATVFDPEESTGEGRQMSIEFYKISGAPPNRHYIPLPEGVLELKFARRARRSPNYKKPSMSWGYGFAEQDVRDLSQGIVQELPKQPATLDARLDGDSQVDGNGENVDTLSARDPLYEDRMPPDLHYAPFSHYIWPEALVTKELIRGRGQVIQRPIEASFAVIIGNELAFYSAVPEDQMLIPVRRQPISLPIYLRDGEKGTSVQRLGFPGYDYWRAHGELPSTVNLRMDDGSLESRAIAYTSPRP